jgi:hypothetical protein
MLRNRRDKTYGSWATRRENSARWYAVQIAATGRVKDRHEALFPAASTDSYSPDANAERSEHAKAHAQRWPFLKVPRYSMPHREGAMVRLDIGQGSS